MPLKIVRDHWKSLGLCTRCGKGDVVPGKTACANCLSMHNSGQLKRGEKMKLTVLEAYGMKCMRCGVDNPDLLCIDHINGGGNEHRRKLNNRGDGVYKEIIKNNFPPEYRLLCWNCNSLTYYEGIEHSDSIGSAYTRKYRWKLKKEICEKYGGCFCKCCGNTDIRILTLDHLDGSGKAHRETIKDHSLWRWAHRNHYPPIFQILCVNCNALKEVERRRTKLAAGLPVWDYNPAANKQPVQLQLWYNL